MTSLDATKQHIYTFFHNITSHDVITIIYIHLATVHGLSQPPSLWIRCLAAPHRGRADMQQAKDPLISRTHSTFTAHTRPGSHVKKHPRRVVAV